MRFFEVVLSGAALISAAFAVEFNSWPDSVKAGQTVTLTYSPKDAATTIILRKGPSTNLDTLQTLTTTSTGGSFEWAVPSSLENGDDYAFEIRQAGAEPNYSGQFALSGGVASAVSSSAYSTKASSAAASSTAHSTEVSTTVKTSVVTSAASASASGSIVPSAGANSTISTGSPSATKSQASGSPTGSSPPVENTGAASSFGVNAAALFGAIGAFAYFA
ncbi:hypothetical protein DPSP01_008209 [Paraphaeosphaeria sporulosa]|uniref:Yeast cell wall synthesis Kre9/Knh1-like N-terminal domain-containing protein n=1 Tax=Paraphaeosphaeria sporulosa TaxID=1460663 RepID=A0A177BW18_9PLEO|nr:uncharacterized protein CC84DRAFT_1223420 [Paraphaeosphaeria sporulosa]OAF99140.1 hypothetical protein CC84DRAFT_1223420 [Paraphaeosphaeria sporulosa]